MNNQLLTFVTNLAECFWNQILSKQVLEVWKLYGSMLGKTEELIRRLKRAEIAQQSILVFKPEIDVRYDKNSVVSHDKIHPLNSCFFFKRGVIQSEKVRCRHR